MPTMEGLAHPVILALSVESTHTCRKEQGLTAVRLRAHSPGDSWKGHLTDAGRPMTGQVRYS